MRLGRPRWHGTAGLCAGVLTAALLAPPVASAAEPFRRDRTPLPRELSEAASGQATGGGGSLWRLAVGLLLVLALLLAIAWLVRRSGRARLASGGVELPVVATVRLAPTRAVHLLRVGEELILVGSAEQGVTPIRVYPAPQAQALAETLERGETVRRLGAGRSASLLDELRRRTAR